MSDTEFQFWNDAEIVDYFSKKPADPVIVSRLQQLSHTGGEALDLGCGGGRHAELLARLGYRVTAVDLNPAMLVHTRERLASLGYTVRTAQMSVEQLDLKDAVYEVVISTGVLHQVRSVAAYKQALAEVSRVLKPQGLFTMNVFTNSIWDDSYTVSDPNEPYTVRTKEGLFMTLLPKQLLYELAKAAGLDLEQEVTEDRREENTGPRAVVRAHFIKR